MHIIIRPACDCDWPDLQNIFLESRRSTYHWLDTSSYKLTDLDGQTQGESVLVAETESHEILGFVSVWKEDKFIHHLYIKPGQQGKGIGRALLHALPAWETGRYTLKCLQRNESALRFYLGCGFQIAGEGSSEEGEYFLLEQKLRRAL